MNREGPRFTLRPSDACSVCHERWRAVYGMCRRCARSHGIALSLTTVHRSSIVKGLGRGPTPTRFVEPTRAPLREVVIQGQWFEITWDGTR